MTSIYLVQREDFKIRDHMNGRHTLIGCYTKLADANRCARATASKIHKDACDRNNMRSFYDGEGLNSGLYTAKIELGGIFDPRGYVAVNVDPKTLHDTYEGEEGDGNEGDDGHDTEVKDGEDEAKRVGTTTKRQSESKAGDERGETKQKSG